MARIFIWLLVIAVLGTGAYFVIEDMQNEGERQRRPDFEKDVELPKVDEPKEERPSFGPGIIEENDPQARVPYQVGYAEKLQGTVRSKAGAPIADARVSLFTYEYIQPGPLGRLRPDHREIFREETRSDENGFYEFDQLADVIAPYLHMRVEAEGYAEVLKDAVGPGMIVDATLESGVPLDILVVDATTKKPNPGVLTDLSFKEPGRTKHEYRRWRRKLKSDPEGRVQVSGAPAAQLTAVLEHPDYEWFYIKPDDAAWRPNAEGQLVFAMKRGVELRGIVVDAGTKEPIQNCDVTFRELIIPTRRARTGVFGKFNFKGLNRGKFEVTFHADGYSRKGMILEISDEAMKDERVFELESAGMASGIVVDEAGEPIAGAEIFVAEAKDIFRAVRDEAEARTDADGVFSVRNLNGNLGYRIVARGPRGRLGFSDDFVAQSGAFVDGVIVPLSPGAELQGRVTDEVGAPVANATVTIEQPPYAGAWFPPRFPVGQKQTVSRVTDETGLYSFDGLWTGPYEMTVDHPDFVPVLPVKLRVDTGNEKLEKSFELVRGKSISGLVLDHEGKPAEGAIVSAGYGAFRLRESTARVDAEGRFTLSRLIDRPYRLKAMSRKGVSPAIEDVPVGTTDLTLTLEPYGMIEGKVVAAETSTPIDRFVVRLYPLMAVPRQEDPRSPRRMDARMAQKLMTSHEAYSETTIVNPDGNFAIAGVHPGSYIVEVRVENRIEVKQEGVVVQPGGVTTTAPYLMRSGAALQGRITDTAGNPLDATKVAIRLVAAPNSMMETMVGPDGKPTTQQGRSSWEARDAHLDKEGRYYLGGLPAGRLQLQLASQFYCVPSYEEISFGKDGIIERSFSLVRGARVVLNVRDQFGDTIDLPGAKVYDLEGVQARVDGRPVAARGDVRGKIEIPKLAPGRYVIELERYAFGPTRVEIEVEEGEELILDAEMEKLVR